MDLRAKSALHAAVLDDNFASGFFPDENVVCHGRWQQSHGIVVVCNWFSLGVKDARELFHSLRIVDRTHFRLYWDAAES